MMPKARTFAIYLILLALGAFALVRFSSEWRAVQELACGDIRDHLHPSRRLMAGYDPNWYITPAFERDEFRQGLTPQRLRAALERDGIAVPNIKSDLQALNLILRNIRFVRKLLKPGLPGFEALTLRAGPLEDDFRRKNRRILEAAYPLQCPRLALKNDLKTHKRPTLRNGPVQSASPSFLVAFYPLYRLPLEFVKPF